MGRPEKETRRSKTGRRRVDAVSQIRQEKNQEENHQKGYDLITLGDYQRAFAREVPRLIDKAHELGYAVTLGDAFRDPRVFGEVGEAEGYGHPRSGHKRRLAIDLNLYRFDPTTGKWDYLTETEDHRPLGEWWEMQAPENRWGGRFNDGNHYSKEFDGIM